MEYEKLYSCEYELFSENIVYRSYIIFHSRRKFDLYMYNDGNQLDVYLNQKFTDVENMIDEYGRVSNLEKKRKWDYYTLIDDIFSGRKRLIIER